MKNGMMIASLAGLAVAGSASAAVPAACTGRASAKNRKAAQIRRTGDSSGGNGRRGASTPSSENCAARNETITPTISQIASRTAILSTVNPRSRPR